MTRIGHSTPSFDTLSPHWDQKHNLSSGAFIEYGSKSLNFWDIRITHFVVSELPHSYVSIAGRATRPKQYFPDFLSIRVGADRPKYFPLSPERTLQLHITAEGQIQRSYIRITRPEFMNRWGEITRRFLTDKNFTVSHGLFTITSPTAA